ncbi:nicotinamide-nucleotide amidase [Arthrobacter woluwensis]|uniref:CinA family protein n=1 Tax=Arthrobacter woluwensis TaxID=156980 RepID=UPI00277E85E8|nr:CinA family protein [Arthrobacter woluwensis]MDQ0708269.1 nicotinamide-nucleotide amidase [Arthrobacter woluwensis]
MPDAFAGTVRETVELAISRGVTVATAESLTAGLVAARLADVPGASATLRGGVVSYHNEVKEHVLGVSGALLAERGSVDAEVARQMAAGALRACGADLAVSTTGVAGPEPHDGKSVGTVFIGIADGLGTRAFTHHFVGGREQIREAALRGAIGHLLDALREFPGKEPAGNKS